MVALPSDFQSRALAAKLRKLLRRDHDDRAVLARRLAVAPGVLDQALAGESGFDPAPLADKVAPLLGLTTPDAVLESQVFVSWDMVRGESLRTLFQGFPDIAPPGLRLEALLELNGHPRIPDAVQKAIQASDLLVAYVDHLNANVAYEIGFALATGLEVLLVARSVENRTQRWEERKPFRAVKIHPASDERQLHDLLLDPRVARLGVRAIAGTGTMTRVLCPRERSGVTLARRLEAKNLVADSDTLVPYDRAPELLAGCGRTLWVIVETDGDRDGPINTDFGYFAGFSEGSGLDLRVLREKSARPVIDVALPTEVWADLDRFQLLLDQLSPVRDPRAPGAPTAAAATPTLDPAEFLARLRRALRHAYARLAGPYAIAMERVIPVLMRRPDHGLRDALARRSLGSPRGGGSEAPLPSDSAAAVGCPPEALDAEASFSSSPRTLLDLVTDPSAPRHLLLRGPLGSGKTTTVNHLVWSLAERDGQPLAVFRSLADWPEGDLFEAEERKRGFPGIAAALRSLAEEDGHLVLVFDGLDEAENPRETWRRIEALAEQHPKARIVVTGRPTAFGEGFEAGCFVLHELQRLAGKDQIELLGRFLAAGNADAAGALHAEILGTPGIREDEIVGSPLFLKLLAEVKNDRKPLPRRLVDLYDRAIDVLLACKHHAEPDRVREPEAAKRILSILALELHAHPKEQWTRQELFDVYDALLRTAPPHPRDPRAAADLDRLMKPWGQSFSDLRDDLKKSGLLVPAGEDDHPWAFYHRSFREYLAALRLRELGSAAWALWLPDPSTNAPPTKSAARSRKPRSPKSATKPADPTVRSTDPKTWPATWGQVFVDLCAIADAASQDRLLTVFEACAPLLFVQSLPNATGLSLDAALNRYLRSAQEWAGLSTPARWGRLDRAALRPAADGDTVAALLEVRDLELRGGTISASRFLLDWARTRHRESPLPFEIRGQILYVLDVLARNGEGESGPAPSEFLAEFCPKTSLSIARVPIPPTSTVFESVLGSPNGEGYESEYPRHRVRLLPFHLGTTTVTWKQYRELDRDRVTPADQTDDHPATGLTWWEAYLFARWVGGRLPTEAEWEAACRAGTATPYSFEGGEDALGDHAWLSVNSGHRAHAVASRLPNPWELQDMHGNVWEWCGSWFGPYDPPGEGPPLDPHGPLRGRDRVLRGGSCRNGAVWCRSAARCWDEPGIRGDWFGFRVAFPAPPSS